MKISGMIDELMDTEQLKKPAQPYEFRSKPAWQRLLIMLGGVTVNLLLGFVIFTFILYTWGEKYLPNKNLTDGIWVVDSIMMDVGLRTGDKIISVNNRQPENYIDILEEMIFAEQMVVNRNGKDTVIDVPKDFVGRLVDNTIYNKGVLIYPRIPFIINRIPDTSHNVNSGLAARDMIVSLNNVPVKYSDEVTSMLHKLRGQKVPVTVERSGEQQQFEVIISDQGKLGVETGYLTFDQMEKLGVYQFATYNYTFMESIPAGFRKAKKELLSYIRQVGKIFDFESGAHKGVGGFVTITKLFPPVWIWQAFWTMTALLSIMLAFINILPIPALDGGHVLFLTYEMISGRKPGDKFLEYAQIAGMFILIFLLLYANGNDVYRLILGLIGKE